MVVGILTTINHPGERKDEHPQAPKVNASKKTLTIKNSWESNTHVILQTCHDHLCNHIIIKWIILHLHMNIHNIHGAFAYEDHSSDPMQKQPIPWSPRKQQHSKQAAFLCDVRCDCFERRGWRPQHCCPGRMWEIYGNMDWRKIRRCQRKKSNKSNAKIEKHIMGNSPAPGATKNLGF